MCSSSDPWNLITDGWDLLRGAHPHINLIMWANVDLFVDAALPLDPDDFSSPHAGGDSKCGSSVVVIDDIDSSKTSVKGEQTDASVKGDQTAARKKKAATRKSRASVKGEQTDASVKGDQTATYQKET